MTFEKYWLLKEQESRNTLQKMRERIAHIIDTFKVKNIRTKKPNQIDLQKASELYRKYSNDKTPNPLGGTYGQSFLRFVDDPENSEFKNFYLPEIARSLEIRKQRSTPQTKIDTSKDNPDLITLNRIIRYYQNNKKNPNVFDIIINDFLNPMRDEDLELGTNSFSELMDYAKEYALISNKGKIFKDEILPVLKKDATLWAR